MGRYYGIDTVNGIRKALAKKGLYVDSYKPGRVRLYRVEKTDKRTGAVTRILSPYMTASEFKAWYDGFATKKR